MNIEGRRRPKARCLDTIESDMRIVGVYVRNVEYRDKWKSRTRVADFIILL